jgi:hypothetical protein
MWRRFAALRLVLLVIALPEIYKAATNPAVDEQFTHRAFVGSSQRATQLNTKRSYDNASA